MFDSANQRKYLWRVEFTEEKELGKPKKLHSQFTHLEPWNQLNINKYFRLNLETFRTKPRDKLFLDLLRNRITV